MAARPAASERSARLVVHRIRRPDAVLRPSRPGGGGGGKKKPWEPQPYAVKKIDEPLLGIKPPQQLTHVRACAFDRERGYLYVLEFRGDEDDKSLVHVWKVTP